MEHAVSDTPAVSVLVPASGAPGAALDAVRAQTSGAPEIVPIRDASPAARNAGVAAARGRYVAFFDAGAVWAPDFLQTLVAFLDRHPTCAVVCADAHAAGPVTRLALIGQGCPIPLAAVVARRDALLAAGPFDEGIRRGDDYDLWLRLALRGVEIQRRRSALVAYQVPPGDP